MNSFRGLPYQKALIVFINTQLNVIVEKSNCERRNNVPHGLRNLRKCWLSVPLTSGCPVLITVAVWWRRQSLTTRTCTALKFDFQGVSGDFWKRRCVTLQVKIELWRLKQGHVIKEFIPYSVDTYNGSWRKTEFTQFSRKTKSVKLVIWKRVDKMSRWVTGVFPP